MERHRARQWNSVLRFVIYATGFIGIPIAFVVWVHPVLGMAVCPRCFGFTRLGHGVFVEKGASQADRVAILNDLVAADRRLEAFFDGSVPHPRVLACETQECVKSIGSGNAQVGSIGPYVLLIAPQGRKVVIIAHELAQIELVNRIGLVKQLAGAVPAWFEQGVDVLASDDSSYLSPRGKYRDRCLADRPGELPADMHVWLEKADSNPVMYAVAACRVDRWMLKRGGAVAVRALLDRVSHGAVFDQMYNGPSHGWP